MFSDKLLEAIEAEAASLGMKGATAISVAIREDLNARKGKGAKTVGDGREQTYFLAARVIEHGRATKMPGVVQLNGLPALSWWARGAAVAALGNAPDKIPDDECAKQHLGPARASLTRKGFAHVVVVLPHSKTPPDCWVDLYVFKTQRECETFFATVPEGKVF